MTIYAPALRLTPPQAVSPIVENSRRIVNADQIAEFVENVCLQTTSNHDDNHVPGAPTTTRRVIADEVVRPSANPDVEPVPQTSNCKDQARDEAARIIMEMEIGKVKLDAPQGNAEVNCAWYSDIVDDEFFHITCHVDQALHNKIEVGQFMELEKLLAKNKLPTRGSHKGRLGLFSCDGMTYFAPAGEKEVKIGNVHRWEQAFRVYAAIYSKANPSRASEIWQYVHVIHLAANTYQWSNVAEYNYTFHQLMSAYPAHFWVKTYLQGWNIIMRDHLVRDHASGSGKGFNKDNICWPFNKGKCNDSSCGKEHKCGYCGKWGHSIFNCRKKKRNNAKRESGKQGESKS